MSFTIDQERLIEGITEMTVYFRKTYDSTGYEIRDLENRMENNRYQFSQHLIMGILYGSYSRLSNLYKNERENIQHLERVAQKEFIEIMGRLGTTLGDFFAVVEYGIGSRLFSPSFINNDKWLEDYFGILKTMGFDLKHIQKRAIDISLHIKQNFQGEYEKHQYLDKIVGYIR